MQSKCFEPTQYLAPKANGTGPAGVWIQLGAKVLDDLAALDSWIESHRVNGGVR